MASTPSVLPPRCQLCPHPTGDYSRVADRHMPPADLPEQRPHILIVEATYGVSRHLPREEREQRFTERIHTAVGGVGCWACWSVHSYCSGAAGLETGLENAFGEAFVSMQGWGC